MSEFQYAPKKENKNFPMGEKFSFSDSVEYAEGSIVSKILIRNDKGNITLFAFDKDEFLSEHTTPFDALLQVIDGQADIVIAGQSHILEAGESIVMPKDIPHAVIAKEKFKMILTMIK